MLRFSHNKIELILKPLSEKRLLFTRKLLQLYKTTNTLPWCVNYHMFTSDPGPPVWLYLPASNYSSLRDVPKPNTESQVLWSSRYRPISQWTPPRAQGPTALISCIITPLLWPCLAGPKTFLSKLLCLIQL